jgi:AcrR family transcriptional regulator
MNMTRTYTMGKRADQQAQTRQRIVEAAVDLHGTVGPAQTTVTMIAERAGVQRHTFYKHFPDERSLMMACSGLAAERDPMPEAEPWRAIGDREERLGTALSEVYAWFGRNAGLMACVTRDAQNHALTREIAELRRGPVIAAYAEVLGGNRGPLGRAALQLALSFPSWNTLVRDAGLSQEDAVKVMVCAVLAAEDVPAE